MKFRTACQDFLAGENAEKCFCQGHNRMLPVDFQPRACRSQS